MRLIVTLLALSTLMGLSACETIKGVGRDVTNAGQALDNAL